MNDSATGPAAERESEQRLRDMNEALLVSSVRQHELTEQADRQRDEAEADRDRAERLAAALRESEKRYHTLFESIDQGFCIIEFLDGPHGPLSDYVHVEANPAFAANSGIPDIVGQKVREIVPGEAEGWVEIYRNVLLTGEPVRFQRELVATGRYLDLSAFRVEPAERRQVAVLFKDITGHKRAEKALRESEDRYRTLFDAMDEGYCIIEVLFDKSPEKDGQPVDYRFIEVNGSFERQTGMHDVIGKRMLEFVLAIEPHWLNNYAKVALTGAGIRFSGEYKGLHRYFDVYAFRAAGWPEHHVAVLFADVTARKQAEQAAARLAAIVTFSEDAIVSKDLDGILTSWNNGAERLFGYVAEEVIGKPVTLLTPHDHLDEEPWILESIRRGEAVEYHETVRRRKDGSLLDISLTVSPLRDAAGRVIGASAIARDITQRRRLERQTQQQAAELSDLHRRKDEFLAMLSHELRNPLAPIANAVQLLRLEKNEDSIQQQARLIIERQVGQLSHLVDDLLEVSRISTGRIHLQRERLDLRTIVERAVETTRPLIGQRGHALSLSLSPTPIWLDADASRLEQVVVNLLTNAAKYTEQGGNIWIGLGQESFEAVLRIRDTGLGIAPELLPRIFDLFSQGERTIDRAQGGLGVGLALVHQLVQLHGGRVEALSVLGQGSEFVVRLPAVSSAPPPSALSFAETARPRGNGCRVLVVDDNVDSATSLALLLRRSGHDVRMAHDGPTAVQAALDDQPDVMLLDIGLPGFSGYEVAKRLRMQPGFQSLLLVAMTGYGQESDRQQSREAGFDHHLVKPANFAQVQKIVAEVVERSG
jgi:PAS domain S-box-containing protein